MFCPKCGSKLEDGAKFCVNCGTPLETPEVQKPGAEIPQEEFVLNTPELAEKKKSGKKKWVLPVSITAAVAAVAVAVALCWGPVMGLFGGEKTPDSSEAPTLSSAQMEEMTPDQLLVHAESNVLGGFTQRVTNLYGTVTGSQSQANQAVTTELNLKIGDEILEMLKQQLMLQGALPPDADLSFLSQMGLKLYVGGQNDKQQTKLSLVLNSTDLIGMDGIVDKDHLYIGIPGYSEYYLAFSDQGGGFQAVPPEVIGMVGSLSSADLPDEKELQEIIDRYIDLILQNVEKVEKEKDTLELDGLKQDCTVLSFKLREKDFGEIAQVLLEAAQKDKQLKKVIEKFLEMYCQSMPNVSAGYVPSVSEMMKSLEEEIDTALDQIKENLKNVSDDKYVKIQAYLDDAGRIIGHKLKLSTQPNAEISFKTVTEGEQFRTEAVMNAVKFTASGTNQGKIVKGEFALTEDGTDIFSGTFENLDLAKWEKGDVCGKFRIKPGKVLAQNITQGIQGAGFVDLAIELDADTSEGRAAIRLLGSDLLILGLEARTTAGAAEKIEIPAKILDPNDPNALKQFTESLNMEKLLAQLRAAGVPEALMKMLEQNLTPAVPGRIAG